MLAAHWLCIYYLRFFWIICILGILDSLSRFIFQGLISCLGSQPSLCDLTCFAHTFFSSYCSTNAIGHFSLTSLFKFVAHVLRFTTLGTV